MITAKPRAVAFVIFPGFQILDAAGPIAAFEIAGRFSPAAYELSVRSTRPGFVASSSGASMAAEAMGQARDLDTLLIAGGDGSRAAMSDAALLRFVCAAAGSARRVASICSGAYVLAAAGLLDGKHATTHWSRSEDFVRRFPAVRLERDRIWTRDGAVWTSAGITAGIDLALAMITEDLGEAVARRTAQQLVVYYQRPGGQSQFSALGDLDACPGRFSPVLRWAREHLSQPLKVEHLAAQAAMSPRNFARAFVRDVGVTPAKAVERLRLEVARGEIDGCGRSIEAIARETGFGDTERMRQAFVRAFGQPPQALRRAARKPAAPQEARPLRAM